MILLPQRRDDKYITELRFNTNFNVIIKNSMYELQGKLHLYKCMHSDNTKFKTFIYTRYNDNMRQMILILTALYFQMVLKFYQLCSNVNLTANIKTLTDSQRTYIRCSRHHRDVKNMLS